MSFIEMKKKSQCILRRAHVDRKKKKWLLSLTTRRKPFLLAQPLKTLQFSSTRFRSLREKATPLF